MILMFCIYNKWFQEYFEATTYMVIRISPVHFTYVNDLSIKLKNE